MPRIRRIIELWRSSVGEKKKLIIQNVFWRGLATGVNKILRLFVLLNAANVLGVEKFGLYSYAISLSTIGFIFSDWGINVLLMREFQYCSDEDAKSKLVSTSFFLKVFIAIVSCLCLVCIFYLKGEQKLLGYGLFFAATMTIGNVRDVAISLFLAVQKAKIEFYIYITESALLLFFWFFVFEKWASVPSLFGIYFFSTMGSALLAFFLLKKRVRLRLKYFNLVIAKQLLRNGFSLSLFGLTSYLFFSADQLILEHYSGLGAVGVYSVGSRVILAISVFPSLLNVVIFPYLSRFRSDVNKMKYIVFRWTILLATCACFFVAAVYALAPILIRAFFTPDYWQIIPLIGPFSFITIGMFVVSFFDYVLIAYNLQKQDFYITLISAAINIVLNLILVPRHGILGVIISSIVSQGCNMLFTGFYVAKILSRNKPEKNIISEASA